MPTEHQILFTGEMVRAILARRKTQTRRVIKPQPPEGAIVGWLSRDKAGQETLWAFYQEPGHDIVKSSAINCPYGTPGDRLWVRETIRAEFHRQGCWSVHYAADNAGVDLTRELPGGPFLNFGMSRKVIPSIHMPRWASRVTLEVMGVRAERVQNITYEDAIAEGVPHDETPAYERFPALWDSINAKRGYSWESNPWVWVVEFKPIAA